MNDENATTTGLADDRIHPGRHFGNARGGALAPVLVPHVANDQGGPLGIPLRAVFDGHPFAAAFGRFDARARVQLDRVSPQIETSG